MTLVEIKKALYQKKPEAHFIHASKTVRGVFLVYGCSLESETGPDLFFEVPVDELGDGLFGATIGAQLLIRYIIQPETTAS